MPGNTSKHRIPYPLASERVADYPTIARHTAEKIDSLTPRAIRVGSHSISRVAGNSNQNFDVEFETPMPTSQYVLILTVGGSGGLAPEYFIAAYKTNGLKNTGFSGRIRNTHNSAQECVVNYIAIVL